MVPSYEETSFRPTSIAYISVMVTQITQLQITHYVYEPLCAASMHCLFHMSFLLNQSTMITSQLYIQIQVV